MEVAPVFLTILQEPCQFSYSRSLMTEVLAERTPARTESFQRNSSAFRHGHNILVQRFGYSWGMSEVTRILNQIDSDPGAAEQLLPLVYEELKNLAAARMASERLDHTLQPTALVHESYVRLVDNGSERNWDNRGHFFAAAAEAMRRILVNHARDRKTEKRGGDWSRVTLNAITAADEVDPGELLAVSDTLDQLARHDSRAAEIAKLRIFAGLSIPEIASVVGMGQRSVDRQWAFARAWLRTQLAEETGVSESLS
jgi:RNA polymerase sigma factor (TIGR02999 family)